MKFLELKNLLSRFVVFSLADIRKIEPGFYRSRLSEWQNKGYIKKIIKNYYIFSDNQVDEETLFYIANKIYNPSYISLEMVLAYYHLIPESIYGLTSITTKKTAIFKTKVGDFSYRSVKPELFFGYSLVDYQGQKIKLAEVEKAILDYLYLNSHLKTESDFSELRLNLAELLASWNETKFNQYLTVFANKRLNVRAKNFINYLKT
ncbi:hypothetical protein KKE48_05865 [Patescibacteria group bacterium]|nr:hypothetical protein [Patescibacteria group bacterium]MBU1500365.1 hypothetical protein [Patescibacteria group bacterium]